MSQQDNDLISVNGDEANRLSANAQLFADGVPPILRPSAMVERGWLSVGVEDELEGAAANNLAAACAAAGYISAWSVEIPWTPTQSTTAASRLPLTARALQSLSKDVCLGSPFVLAEESQRFAVASSGDLYWMVAGRREFVEAAVGATVEQQLATFEKVAQSYSKSGSLAGRRLTAVHTATIEAYKAYG